MNGGSIVKLLFDGWHVPQVRPLPLNVSLKNRSAPCEISLSSFTDPPDALSGGEKKLASASMGELLVTAAKEGRSSVSAARSGTSAKRLGGGVVSVKRTLPVPAFSSDKRLKNIFWKTFTVPAPSCSPPHRMPGVTTMRSMVRPNGRPSTKVPGQKRRGSDGEKGGQSGQSNQEGRDEAALRPVDEPHGVGRERRQPAQAGCVGASLQIHGHFPGHPGEIG